MPATIITTSPNVAIWDEKIVADICLKKFFIDASPSVWIGSGASNVLGAKVKIVNPYGVTIKDYTGSYDIATPLSAIYEQNIPTQAGTVQYGTYVISLQLTDADSTTYEVTKSINVCTYNKDTDPCDNRLRLIASCKNGTLTIALSEPPVFKGFLSQSRTQTVVVNYPTASGVVPLTSTNGSFSVQLFEGVYKVVVTVCATYNLTDNVYLKLPYAVTVEKNVKCLLDYTCIWPRVKQLNDKIAEDCSQADKNLNASIILDALRLIKTVELANDAGEDASPYIADLEKLLGCPCTCDCLGLPITNNEPSTNINIEGCNVLKTTVGLTDIFTIENYEYIVAVDTTQDIITVSAPSLTDCVKTQTLSFSISNVYAGIKTEINSNTEYNYWASVIKLALSGLNVSCLDAPTTSLLQLIQSIINKACAGGSCTASITGNSTSNVGSDVILTWTQTGGYKTEIYVDGILLGTVLIAEDSFTIVGGADGNNHTYLLIPICTNGSNGTVASGVFNELGCPTVTPPVVSSNSVTDAECPYDITSLLSTPPAGITVEWHTANNTLSHTLVPDPTNVSGGIYYAFSKDADGCYSSATSVTVICASATSCTAPQSLQVILIGGNHRVMFNSAANPPPGNSYTVKRRLYSAPDVDGSYTTIGTPTFATSLGKWVINDATASANTLYVYKAISNCGGSPATTPFTTATFANMTCPSVTLTPGNETIGYSFSNVGGQVDKYEVKIYDSTGLTLIHTDTIVPAFSSPITGTFLYLTSGTNYKVMVTSFIGSYSQDCTVYTTATNTVGSEIEWSYTESGGGGSLSILQNGVTIVNQTSNGSGSFAIEDGDDIDVVITGAGGTNRALDIVNETTSTSMYSVSGAGNDGFSFTSADGTTYSVTGVVS